MGMTPWSAMKKQPDNETFGTFCVTTSFNSQNSFEPLLSLCVRDIALHGESLHYTRLKKMVFRYLVEKAREKHFSSRERQLENPACAAGAAKSKSKGKGERNSGDCVQWTTKGQCSRGDECSMTDDPENKREPKGKGKASRSPTTCFAFNKGKCPKDNACDYWHPP